MILIATLMQLLHKITTPSLTARCGLLFAKKELSHQSQELAVAVLGLALVMMLYRKRLLI